VLLTGASGAPGVAVTVTVSDVRSAEGVVRACMTADRARFPRCRGVPGAHSAVVPARGTIVLTFTGVAPGRYAIALLHDENANGKADRALGMMPREGFGFSRDAPVRMGPPSFDDAAFSVAGAPVTQRIRMRYML
jgi:uncharacterized protein (DUF2141 family)